MSFLSKGLSKLYSSTKILKHQFLGTLTVDFFFFFPVLQLHFIYKIAGESKTQREESGGVRGEGGREGEREREREKRAHALGRESLRESALAPPFICFFFHLGLPYANRV